MKYEDLKNVLFDFYEYKKEHSRNSIFPTAKILKGKKFYRYCSLNNDYILSDILNQRIHVSPVSSFNDCYDSKPKINFKSADLLLSKTFKRRLNNPQLIHKAILDWLEEFANSLFCACLTDDNNNLLMWTHYSNNSKGICIEYDLLDTLDKYDTITVPIVYSKKRSSLSPSCLVPKKHYVSEKQRLNDDRELVAIYTTKAECWEYESEYRVFIDVKSAGNHYIEGIKITAVFLGPRISEKDKNVVLEVCKKIGCKVYLMILNNDEFKYIPELIYDGV